jgi:hypothetical protein
VVGFLCLAFAVSRLIWCTLYETHSLHVKHRSPLSKPGAGGFKTLAVLGSGGHTAELLRLVKDIVTDESADRIRLKSIKYVIADTDTTSKTAAVAVHVRHPLPQNTHISQTPYSKTFPLSQSL